MKDERMSTRSTTNSEYAHWLKDLKAKIRTTQIKAACMVNHEILSYAKKKSHGFFYTFFEQEQIVHPTGAQFEPAIVPRLGGQLLWRHIKVLLGNVAEHQQWVAEVV